MPDHPSPDDPTLAAPPRVDRLTGAAASSSDAAPRHDTGRALDTSFPFERGALLGSGGMGDVVAGVDRRLGREVAIKTLQPGHTADARTRFLREARITSRLEHPNIVPVHELTTDPAGNLCLVMKVVRGITLDTWIRDRRPPLADRIDVFGRICDAIAFAHAHRI
ncbi:MAG: protein kinase, partial [Planctomycetota bacterium]